MSTREYITEELTKCAEEMVASNLLSDVMNEGHGLSEACVIWTEIMNSTNSSLLEYVMYVENEKTDAVPCFVLNIGKCPESIDNEKRYYYSVIKFAVKRLTKHKFDYSIYVDKRLVGEVENGVFEPTIEVMFYEFLGIKFDGIEFEEPDLYKGAELSDDKREILRIVDDLEKSNVSSVRYDKFGIQRAKCIYDTIMKNGLYLKFHFPKINFNDV